MSDKYSVLMSVYKNEKASNLKQSIESMINQTIAFSEFVLVKDGPVDKDLDDLIEDYKKIENFKVLSLKNNVGLGKALEIGLNHCTNDLIVRMDSDDISVPERCEIQLSAMKNNPNISVVGSAVEEFIDGNNHAISLKPVKTEHHEIIHEMKYRNPVNHPTVMFKKDSIEAVGGYKEWLLNEDYYLWIRLASAGHVFHNINEPLVKMRINNETYLRRGGWKYFILQKKLFDFMREIKFISNIEYFYNNLIRFMIRVLIPNKLRKVIYLNFLRKPLR